MTHLFVMYFYFIIFTLIYNNVIKHLLYRVVLFFFVLVFTLTGPYCKTVFYRIVLTLYKYVLINNK